MSDPVGCLSALGDGWNLSAPGVCVDGGATAASNWFAERPHVLQAFLASLFTWGMTALGAALVFFAKRVNQKQLDAMLGFSAGVMLAASYWSLLAPAIDLSEGYGRFAWFPAAMGFALGALALSLSDRLMPHFQLGAAMQAEEGAVTTWRRTMLLVLAITLHNIPEGLAVGVAFGAVACDPGTAGPGAAVALAIGIGLQNFPEGAAVAMPLRRVGWPRFRSFWYGQLSAVVEPVAAVVGAAAVTVCFPIMPYALAFAAGAMIYVVIAAVIPESRQRGNTNVATLGAILGFIVMLILDVALA
ncbi:Zinc/iron permease [Methylocaldum marinum]|uniref:Zinc/iron permease n=1 Tax=Methylocaldum marinum TaxID=1432792 RepID=A0A250KNS1_9GAMM|nr:ZIP family metal transporter [Methylocaldum marinum]BBA33186.1 Zinc/iron permease [Methylocaldum marinum]